MGYIYRCWSPLALYKSMDVGLKLQMKTQLHLWRKICTPVLECPHQVKWCVFKPLYVLRLECKVNGVLSLVGRVLTRICRVFLSLRKSPIGSWLMHLCLYKITRNNYAYFYFYNFSYKTRKREGEFYSLDNKERESSFLLFLSQPFV